MPKVILTTKIDPTYDDLPEERYHFPRTYLNQVTQAVNDFVIYYEPRRSSGDANSRGGRQAYFAVAFITAIEADITKADHFYALVTSYLEFDQPVPFRNAGRYYESALRRADGHVNKGAFGRSVRVLADDEFSAILQDGFNQHETLTPLEAALTKPGFEEPRADFNRPIVERLVARPFRDQAFMRQVHLAYENRCAVTGLRLINGGGLPEVEAAHIRPVAQAGPDSPRNGLALCRTAHWMFDRGLISIDDDFRILSARRGLPDDAERLFLKTGELKVPDNPVLQPHPQFLRWHRENVFKG